MYGNIKLFSGSSCKRFADQVAFNLESPLGDCTIKKFSNENIKVRVNESVRGQDVFVFQTSCSPVSENLVELLVMVDAIKNARAERVTAVCPYFPYVRSDKKDEPRISITAKLMGKLLQAAGADAVMTMNLHSWQIQGFFDIPCDHLLAGRTLCEHYGNEINVERDVVVAPDAGSAKLAVYYARKLHLPIAICDKRREDDSEQPKIRGIIGDVKGKRALVFDDEIASGGSMIQVADALREAGAEEIEACCVHGVLSGEAPTRIAESGISKVTITDTIPVPQERRFEGLSVVTVAPLFTEAIKRVHCGEPISKLYW